MDCDHHSGQAAKWIGIIAHGIIRPTSLTANGYRVLAAHCIIGPNCLMTTTSRPIQPTIHTCPCLQPEASFFPSGDHAMYMIQCL